MGHAGKRSSDAKLRNSGISRKSQGAWRREIRDQLRDLGEDDYSESSMMWYYGASVATVAKTSSTSETTKRQQEDEEEFGLRTADLLEHLNGLQQPLPVVSTPTKPVVVPIVKTTTTTTTTTKGAVVKVDMEVQTDDFFILEIE